MTELKAAALAPACAAAFCTVKNGEYPGLILINLVQHDECTAKAVDSMLVEVVDAKMRRLTEQHRGKVVLAAIDPKGAAAIKDGSSAVCVTLPASMWYGTSKDNDIAACFKKRGFYNHHVIPGPTAEDPDQVYLALWMSASGVPNKIPPHSTASGGVGAIVFSADLKHVALVHERGRWGIQNGFQERDELGPQTSAREALEEIGIEVDPNVAPWEAGGYDSTTSRWPGMVNVYRVYAWVAAPGTTADTEFKTDTFEIGGARWLAVADIVAAEKAIVAQWLAATDKGAKAPHFTAKMTLKTSSLGDLLVSVDSVYRVLRAYQDKTAGTMRTVRFQTLGASSMSVY